MQKKQPGPQIVGWTVPSWKLCYNTATTDLAKIKQYADGELDEIVANYEWTPVDPSGKHYGITIKIKVYKHSENRFMAMPSRRVKTPKQATPYMSLEEKDTVEEALMDCIRGFKMFMGTAAETEWPETEDF